MDKSGKFLLPSPKFKTLETSTSASRGVRHFLSPDGIQLLPKEEQPPPMYGPRGTTVPPKFLSPLKVPTTNNQFDRKQKYFCEPCEAEFHTSTDYKVHKSEHVQCEIDECKFRGHPAFMDTHIGQQHATGLYNQLKKLSTPEEIAQWRADRKKNYPTVASVEQKHKAREQRILRGEKLELQNKKRFGNRADRRQIKGDDANSTTEKEESTNKRKRGNNKNKRQRNRKFEKNKKKREEVSTPPVPVKEELLSVEIEVPEVASCGSLRMFQGTRGLADYKKMVKKTETNVLSSLLGMYGSDSEDDTEENSGEEEILEKDNKKSEEKSPEQDNPVNLIENSSGDASILESEPERQIKIEESESQATSFEEKHIEEVSVEETPIEEASTGEQLIQKTPIEESPKETIRPKESEPQSSDDDEGPEEAAISKSTSIPDKPKPELPQKKKPQTNPLKRKSALDYRKLRKGRQNTMLEKLLETDIRHERNILLQCVRFVVQNNFLTNPRNQTKV